MKNLMFKAYVSIFLFLFLFSIKISCINISIDLTSHLKANFGFVRGYVIKGARSKEILGLNHLIRNAVVNHNKAKVKKEPAAQVIKNSFSIDQQMYPIVDLITITKGSVDVIKKAVSEAIDQYKKGEHSFSLFIEPKAHFFDVKPYSFNVVQFVKINHGKKRFDILVGLLAKKLKEHGVKFQFPQSAHFVNIATVKASDADIIRLALNDAKIANHLASTRAPKGSDNMLIKEIKIFDGVNTVGSYNL